MKMTSSGNEPISYYIQPEVKKTLDHSKEVVINKDWDRVYIIDGSEGCGKSLLGLQLGYYLDPTLNLDRVTFTGEEFSNAIKNAEKNQCIIFDEAFNGLSSSGATSKLNKLIVSKLMECRQKNLFVIIILPTIFLLQKYAAIFRSKVLFHVFASKKGDRGFYKVYNEQNKKFLYLNGKKYYSYSKPFIPMTYTFRGKYPIDEKSYREKKLKSIESEMSVPEITKQRIQRDKLIVYMRIEKGMECKEISMVLSGCPHPITPQRVSQIVLNHQDESRKKKHI